jgi:orotidine-5'-phosphate decarboxylase
MTARFTEMLTGAQQRADSLLCVGLDPDITRFPDSIGRHPERIADFNRAIIDATADIVSCYKPNFGFYVAYGLAGITALARLRDDVPSHIPILLDAKIGDMDMTVAAYARGFFDEWGFDAVTANPLLGHDSLQPLLDYHDRAVFVLAKTSNPGSGLLQDRVLIDAGTAGRTMTMQIVQHAQHWNTHGNVGLVAGATYPEQLGQIRAAAPDLPILVPGIGAQAGDLEAATRAGLDADRAGLIISSSRAICYASAGNDFQDAARSVAQRLRDEINQVRRVV